MATDHNNTAPVFFQIIRWFARISGTIFAFIAVVSLFFSPLSFSDIGFVLIIERLSFFVMIGGFLTGWKLELASGVTILCGYVIFAAINKILYLNWMFALFPVIGACYLVLGLIDYRKKHSHL